MSAASSSSVSSGHHGDIVASGSASGKASFVFGDHGTFSSGTTFSGSGTDVFGSLSVRIDLTASFSISGSASGTIVEKFYFGLKYYVTYTSGNGSHCACFASGTRLLTAKGPVKVESLALGDLVVTASGAHRPIKWIGHRTLDLTTQPDQRAVQPVRVEANAFAANKPQRDLWLSPAHAVALGGHLCQIERLINGTTIAQVPLDTVTYWHIELDSHDVVFAEGLEAETYLDTGNRTDFVEGGAYLELHPTFRTKLSSDTCLPIVATGPDLFAMRAALLDRAETLGHAWTSEHDLHVVADGVRIEATPLAGQSFAFDLPAGSADIALVSRTWMPAQATAEIEDYRTLGVCVGVLHADGRDLSLADLGEGWSRYETDGVYEQRWTTGTARVPAGVRRMVVHLNGRARYLVSPATLAFAQAA